MTQLAHALAAESNPGADKCIDDFFWRDLLIGIFPNDTAAWTASFTKTSVAAAAHVLRGRNGLSGKALVNLLRSPVGDRILDAICADVDWRALEMRLVEISKLQKDIEQKRSALPGMSRR